MPGIHLERFPLSRWAFSGIFRTGQIKHLLSGLTTSLPPLTPYRQCRQCRQTESDAFHLLGQEAIPILGLSSLSTLSIGG